MSSIETTHSLALVTSHSPAGHSLALWYPASGRRKSLNRSPYLRVMRESITARTHASRLFSKKMHQASTTMLAITSLSADVPCRSV